MTKQHIKYSGKDLVGRNAVTDHIVHLSMQLGAPTPRRKTFTMVIQEDTNQTSSCAYTQNPPLSSLENVIPHKIKTPCFRNIYISV
jgi:hypothetical protein